MSSSSAPSRTEPSEILIDETNPEVLAAQIIEQHQLFTDRDFDLLTERNDSARRDPVREVVEKLTCAQLGELICTDRDAAIDVREWFGMYRPSDDANGYMALKDWAAYIITMCVYAQLNETMRA
jgi:hypothetical protein